MFYHRSGGWVVVETNQDNVDHHKVGSIYGGRGLGRYTGLDRGYVCIVICGATCADIDEVIGADIPWSIFDAQVWYPMLLRNFLIEVISCCSDKI
jgi:hypothetical protein